MSSSVPTPVAAAIGFVPTVLLGVRQLPGKAVHKAVHLPILAVSSALTGLDSARRGYVDMAERGERLIARLRGTSCDELEDRVEDALARTPFATPYDRVEDALEDVVDTVTAFVRPAARTVPKAQPVPEAEPVPADVPVPADEAPKGVPTPKASRPDTTVVTTAASPEVVETVERVSATIGGTVVAHDELPLPDFDHLTLGAVRGRMRSLDVPQLVQLRDYEKAKANRLPVVTLLDNRIAKLAVDPTPPLTEGDATGPTATRNDGLNAP